MSRHRNVRGMDYDEEYEGYFDVYGHSVPEDDYCISPTAAQFIYKRDDASNISMSNFIGSEGNIKEEDENSLEEEIASENNKKLSEEEEVKLQSCITELKAMVGDAASEAILRKAVILKNFNFEQALDHILTHQSQQKLDIKTKEKSPDSFSSNKLLTPAVKVVIDSSEVKNTVKKCYPSNRTPIPGFEIGENAPRSRGSTPKSSRNNSRERVLEGDKFGPKKTSSKSENNINNSKNQEKIMSAYKERLGGKELINMVVIGHVDAGKSTLMGHLLFKMGCVNKRSMHKYQQESQKLGKGSFMYAWVLDETGEERSRGITMDIAQSEFETDHKIVTLLDAPGHKDFIPNMITGASQADVAVLVVDATRGEFETGFDSGGQTREHAILVKSLGVSQLTVAVNKLDNVGWSQDRFNEIKDKLKLFLKQVGYKECDVKYIPCSGLVGENIAQAPTDEKLKAWYEGPTLLQRIDEFSAPERAISKPLRLTVTDVFKGQTGGFCVAGLIETGCIQSGDKVLVMPIEEQMTVKAISIGDNPVTQAFAGDHVILSVSGMDMNNVVAGNIVCDILNPIKTGSVIRARVILFNPEVPLTKGFPVVLHSKSLSEQASISKLIALLNKSTGEVAKKKPRCLTKNSSAEIEIKTGRPICIEVYKDYKELGRITLRSGGSTIAAGLVTQISS